MEMVLFKGLSVLISTKENPIKSDNNHGYFSIRVDSFEDGLYYDSIHVGGIVSGDNLGYLNFRLVSTLGDLTGIIPLLNPSRIAKLLRDNWNSVHPHVVSKVYFREQIGFETCLKSASGVDQRSGQHVVIFQ